MNKKQESSADSLGLVTSKMSDGDIAANITGKRSWFVSASRDTRRQWLVNAAFARAQQWSILHKTDDRLVFPQIPDGHRNITVDKIGPWKERTIADITAAIPMFQAVPEGDGGDNVVAARKGTAFLQYFWDNWRFDVQKIIMAGYIVDFGNAFIYLNCVEDANRFIFEPTIDAETGNEATNPDGSPIMVKKSIRDIIPTVIMPHYIATTLDPTALEDKPWVIIQQQRTMSYFTDTYGKKGEQVQPEQTTERNDFHIDMISKQKDGDSRTVEYATELIYFQKPCETNRDGVLAIVAGGVTLRNEKWPYNGLDTYPIEHLHEPKQSGEFFARSRIERCIPLQRSLNLLVSLMIEDCDSMVHKKWMNPLGSGVNTITNDNDIIEYNHPFEPHQSQVQPLPQYPFDMINYLERAIQDVQSYHGASLGTSQAGVRSESHAQLLTENDSKPLNVLDEIIRVGYERMGEKVLQIAADKLDVERIITYTDADGRDSAEKFRGAMLGTIRRVKVRMNNTWTRNKAQVTQTLLAAAQYGMITDSMGRPSMVKAMKGMEFALPDALFTDLKTHSNMAYKENDRMRDGMPAYVTPYQNHMIHMDTHEEWLNSAEFMDLIERSAKGEAQAKQIIALATQHHGQHGQMLAQAMGMLQPAGSSQGNQSEEGASATQEERPDNRATA